MDERISLSGSAWIPATVPGSAQCDLHLYTAGGLHQGQWVYMRDFTVPEHWDQRRLFLQFDGFDYPAEFFLDGESLGTHTSTNRPARFELSDRLTPGQTYHLAVAILESAPQSPQSPQGVLLIANGTITITDLKVEALPSVDLTSAEVTVTCRLDRAGLVEVALTGPVGQVIAEFQSAGAAWFSHTFTLEHPELWWPNGLGGQSLYRCCVRVEDGTRFISDSRVIPFAIRRFTITPEHSFTVNDQPFFAKGWNWVPVDLMNGRGDLSGRCLHLIELARTSGANLLRVWGGGLTEPKLFYDLCDEAGLLIWQEFPLSSSALDTTAPTDPEHLALLEREAESTLQQATIPQAHRVLSQFLQMENLRCGVESNRRRWPSCGGAIIWLLNEPWPNGHHTSVVDDCLRPKLAYYAVKRAFQPVAVSLAYQSPIMTDGRFRGRVFAVADRPVRGTLLIILADPTGRRWHIEDRPVQGMGALDLGEVQWELPPDFPEVLICTLSLAENGGRVGRAQTYLFSRANQPFFGSLRWLPSVALLVHQDGDHLVIHNPGPVCALFPMADIDDPRFYWQLEDNGALLWPGETWRSKLTLKPTLKPTLKLTLTDRVELADADRPCELADPDRPCERGATAPLRITVTGWNVPATELVWELPQ